MMNGALGGLNQQIPPTPPQTNGYNVAVNGQSTGPYTVAALAQMAASGQFTKDSLVWKAGMSNWVAAGTVQELASVFNSVPLVPPPVPSN